MTITLREVVKNQSRIARIHGKCEPHNRFPFMDCYTLKPNERIRKSVKYNPKTDVLRRVNECNDIIAIDTETYQGTCKLIANSKGKYILNPSFDECLKFLTYNLDNKGTYRFFFNIDFDISAILKLHDDLELINDIVHGKEVLYKNYSIKYVKSSFFVIKNLTRKRNAIFTDLFKFFTCSLNEASKEFLDNLEKDKIDGNLLNTSHDYWNDNLDDIIKYCIKDCELTVKVAWKLIDSIIDLQLPLPRVLASPASISKAFFRFENRINNLKDIPIRVLQAGYDSYAGGRFEVFELGKIGKGFLYDINSQYPSLMENLPNIDVYENWNKKVCWKENIELPEKLTLGFYLAEVNIPFDVKHIPNIWIRHKSIIKFPSGKFWKWFTWFDLDLVREYIVSIHKSYEYIPNDKSKYPFRKGIRFLYENKTKIKHLQDTLKMEYRILKITMNGLYGTFIEIHDNIDELISKTGIMFNPIYASWITAFGRWSVIKDIPKDNHNHIKAIHTDSLISNVPLDKFIDIGNKIGEWSLEASGKCYIIGTGQYQVGKIIKTRGIPKKIIVKGKEKKLIISWSKFLDKNWNKSKYVFKFERMKKIREALIQDSDLFLVNQKVQVEREIIPNSDSKRVWQIGLTEFNHLKHYSWKSCSLYFDNGVLGIHNESWKMLNKPFIDSLNV